jgi:hypothetical protein
MHVATLSNLGSTGWRFDTEPVEDPQLVIWFAAYGMARTPGVFEGLRDRFPNALIAGCSTNGEIYRGEVMDGVCVAAAVRFDSTEVKAAYAVLEPGADAKAAGRKLALELDQDGLKGVFVLTDAFSFNGADLVDGLIESMPAGVELSGGMAGDDAMLGAATLAGLNEAPRAGGALALGFYGPAIRISRGVAGGWDALGPSRHVTRSEGAVVYELDGEPALAAYERLVGDADTIARIRHPFAFKPEADSEQDVIREVVGVDRANNGIIFIDTVQQGSWGQILRGTDEHLIDGAGLAARRAGMDKADSDALCLMVSCVGRKWVMGQGIGDETEAVQQEAPDVATIGFYSYGEIAPHERTGLCTLHHASVSVTLLREVA